MKVATIQGWSTIQGWPHLRGEFVSFLRGKEEKVK